MSNIYKTHKRIYNECYLSSLSQYAIAPLISLLTKAWEKKIKKEKPGL